MFRRQPSEDEIERTAINYAGKEAIRLSRITAAAALLVSAPPVASGQAVHPLDEPPTEEMPVDVRELRPGMVLAAFMGEESRRLSGHGEFVEVYNEPAEVTEAGALAAGLSTVCGRGGCAVYKIERVVGPDGTEIRRYPRVLSPIEVALLAGTTPGSDAMRVYGTALMGAQLEFNKALTGWHDPTGGVTRVNEKLGITEGPADDCYPSDFDGPVPEGASRCPPDRGIGLDPWMDPFAMIYAGGAIVYDASEGVREAEQSLASSAALAQAEADEQASALSQLTEIGVEKVGGRWTNRYTGPLPPDQPAQEVEGREFEWDRVSFWIDPEDLVLVKHRFEGTVTGDGQSREFFVEVVNSDFRNPPGCGEMYEPYRRIQRMGGILDEAQMARMEEARRQLEEFDRQMAEMPESERQMVEKMMGSQMDALRSVTDDGAVEHVTEIEEILCDPDLKALFGVPGMEDAMPDGLLERIQRHLVTLGYEPGNTNGVLDHDTRSAISRFQTEHDLPVTGEPSAELESVLAAEVEELDSN